LIHCLSNIIIVPFSKLAWSAQSSRCGTGFVPEFYLIYNAASTQHIIQADADQFSDRFSFFSS